MQLRAAGTGGQWKIRGNVINVESKADSTIDRLPRTLDDTFVVPVQLKRKKIYKHSYIFENIRPSKIWQAAKYLVNNSVLQENLLLNYDWMSQNNVEEQENVTEEHSDMINDLDNRISDYEQITDIIDQTENLDLTPSGHRDTLIAPTYFENEANKVMIFSPGEGSQPLNFFIDADSEYLSFPTIYGGKRRLENEKRYISVPYSTICKWELRNVDRRCAQNVPNIFYKFRKLQIKHVSDKASFSIRKVYTKKNLSVADVKSSEAQIKLSRVNEGYKVFRTIKTSPSYWEAVKKDMFALIRQKGVSTFFITFSCADTHWPDLLKLLAKVNKGEIWTDEDFKKKTFLEKANLIKTDPVTTVRHYHYRRKAFQTHVIKHSSNPIGKVIDFNVPV